MKERFGLKIKIYIFFILNLSMISCGEEVNSQYTKIILPQLKITKIEISNEKLDLTENLKIKFNSQVSRSSLYKGISCKTGSKNAYVYMYLYKHDDGDLVKLIPYYPFIPYVKYICKRSTEVTNIYDEPIDKEYEFSFKTGDKYYSDKEFNPSYYSYDNVYQFLQRRCSDCHNESHILNFKQEKQELYNYLTQTEPLGDESNNNKFYIVADDTDNSYLMNKLMGIDFYGDKMPVNQEIPLYELEKIIGWIRTGAKYEKN